MKTTHNAGKLLPLLLALVMVLGLLPAAAYAEEENWGETKYILEPAGYFGREYDSLEASRTNKISGETQKTTGYNISDIKYIKPLSCTEEATATLYANFSSNYPWAHNGEITATVPSLGHDFHEEDIIPTLLPTYKSDGAGTCKCRRCGHVEKVLIDRLVPDVPYNMDVSVQLQCTEDASHSMETVITADRNNISSPYTGENNDYFVDVTPGAEAMTEEFTAGFGRHMFTGGPEKVLFRFDSLYEEWVQHEIPVYTFSCADDIPIDATTFPDPVFRDYVSQNADTDCSGTLSPAEAAAVRTIDISNENNGPRAASLEGIGYFKNLAELLCKDNHISNLDLSENTALEKLDCHWNHLETLDLSCNTGLMKLDCMANNDIASLNVSMLSELEELNCGETHISKLDLSTNTELIKLDCHTCELTELDLSKNILLYDVDCSSNDLRSLDVSMLPSLKYLTCVYNEIGSLDLTGNPVLRSLSCGNNNLAFVDLSTNTELRYLLSDNNIRSVMDGTALSALKGFDASRVSDVKGGRFDGGVVSFDAGSDKITYNYDCRGDGEFIKPFSMKKNDGRDTHTVTYISLGEVFRTVEKKRGEDMPITDFNPINPGFRLAGWSETENGEVKYVPGKSYITEDRNLTLYAVWEKLKPGDVNGDGFIDTQDLLHLMRVLSIEGTGTLYADFDVNCDSLFDIMDLIALMKILSEQ